MKISELTTEQGLDVICEIVPFVASIIEDESLAAELQRKLKITGEASKAEVYAAGIEKMTKLIPILLKSHRDDVYGIVAAINGKTAEEVAAQSALKTAAEIKDIVTDMAFKDFFA